MNMGSWGSLAILPAWGAGNLSSNLSEPTYILIKIKTIKKIVNIKKYLTKFLI